MKKCYKKSKRGEKYSTNNKIRKADWIGHILPGNCLLIHVIGGKINGRIQVTGRRSKQLLDDLKEKRGYCKLKEGTLDRTRWRTSFGREHGPIVRQTPE
jgi:hypothetical protein